MKNSIRKRLNQIYQNIKNKWNIQLFCDFGYRSNTNSRVLLHCKLIWPSDSFLIQWFVILFSFCRLHTYVHRDITRRILSAINVRWIMSHLWVLINIEDLSGRPTCIQFPLNHFMEQQPKTQHFKWSETLCMDSIKNIFHHNVWNEINKYSLRFKSTF